MLKGKNIVVGVTGCSSAYQAADIVKKLVSLRANVDVIMTSSATKFIAPLTFRNISGHPVIQDQFADPVSWDEGHKKLADKADLLLIAPATANIIGKAASGIADDILSTTIMSTEAFTIFAPHMNPKMYRKPVVQRNIQTLQKDGCLIIQQEKLMPSGKKLYSMLADTEFIIKEVTRLLLAEE
ncbi:phosphopantothenoylcysteine decarboxylase/phosphopantothenate--cysteine ligase [Sporomusaceae bacterium BoRhaA]|uniref:flavoprotein n=1 Tax=Pelorhabdus rhamnosifermentans TaxID=2772457 RepID=UPI001C062DFA|nr:flavoprotein [Pelorhabdus rhamnosifermentans]MBU2703812.1 phosphopantothenoylcysteine decarboxylase/phosphopantothenate--cysteine ligase [Pelorhabdus rhamnosifermentans]